MDVIASVFQEILGLEPQEITDDLAYETCDRWDSLKHLEIVSALESRFGIAVEIDDILAMESVGRTREIIRTYGVL